jgi:hypothetical protein
MGEDETLKKQAAINNGNALASSLHTGDISYFGMTKREQFTAMAMQVLMTSQDQQGRWQHNIERCARISVEMADAILLELENTKP